MYKVNNILDKRFNREDRVPLMCINCKTIYLISNYRFQSFNRAIVSRIQPFNCDRECNCKDSENRDKKLKLLNSIELEIYLSAINEENIAV